MSLFTKRIVQFIFFCILFYLLFLFSFGKYIAQNRIVSANLGNLLGANGHLNTRLIEVQNMKDIDILFLGSSHSYRGFDTRVFNSKNLVCFNLGSSAQTPIQTKVLLQRYLSQLNPRLIVYAVDPEMFSMDGVESSLDIISNDVIDTYILEMSFIINHITVYNTLAYAFLKNLFGPKNDSIEPISKDGDTYIPGGYVERDIEYFKVLDYPLKDLIFKDYQVKAFKEIIILMKNKGYKKLLVYTPITRSFYNSYTSDFEFDSIMKSSGLYYNFNESLNLNDSLHFYDKDHLNQSGVEIFNTNLLEIIPQYIECEN